MGKLLLQNLSESDLERVLSNQELIRAVARVATFCDIFLMFHENTELVRDLEESISKGVRRCDFTNYGAFVTVEEWRKLQVLTRVSEHVSHFSPEVANSLTYWSIAEIVYSIGIIGDVEYHHLGHALDGRVIDFRDRFNQAQ